MNRSFLCAFVAICAGLASQASASIIDTGTVSYQFTGYSSNSGCVTAPTGEQQENFMGTVTDANSLNGATLAFSLCNDPGAYVDTQFTVTLDANDVISGTVLATDLGDVFSDGNTIDTENVSGTFLVTSATGAFAGEAGFNGDFSAITQENLQTGAGTGSFSISTPEPATMALTGLGLFVVGFARRRRKPPVE